MTVVLVDATAQVHFMLGLRPYPRHADDAGLLPPPWLGLVPLPWPWRTALIRALLQSRGMSVPGLWHFLQRLSLEFTKGTIHRVVVRVTVRGHHVALEWQSRNGDGEVKTRWGLGQVSWTPHSRPVAPRGWAQDALHWGLSLLHFAVRQPLDIRTRWPLIALVLQTIVAWSVVAHWWPARGQAIRPRVANLVRRGIRAYAHAAEPLAAALPSEPRAALIWWRQRYHHRVPPEAWRLLDGLPPHH